MLNIPDSGKKRIVIVGCGFGGLTLGRKLKNSGYQVVVIDKHNYHQFPPLFYEVASAGLDATSVLFPLRKIFQRYEGFHIRKAEVRGVEPSDNRIITNVGELHYDYLVLAHGATNSFFGSVQMQKHSKSMKTIGEVIDLRNTLLMNFEKALVADDEAERDMLTNVVIIGGGPSGVEIAGAIAEMNKYVIPKDFPEFRHMRANIYLLEAAGRLLNVMSQKSSDKAREFLEKSGVKVLLRTKATGCDESHVFIDPGGGVIATGMIIWTAGIKGNVIKGISPDSYARGGRLLVDRENRISGYSNVFALGDIAYMSEERFPYGHPQVAQVAIQQAKNLALNFRRMAAGKSLKPFTYKDLGTMATIGRNLAVVELPYFKFQGIFGWFVWMFIHLMSIVGVKNKLVIFINWAWKYFTYDQSTRLILRPKGFN